MCHSAGLLHPVLHPPLQQQQVLFPLTHHFREQFQSWHSRHLMRSAETHIDNNIVRGLLESGWPCVVSGHVEGTANSFGLGSYRFVFSIALISPFPLLPILLKPVHICATASFISKAKMCVRTFKHSCIDVIILFCHHALVKLEECVH